MPGRGGNSAPGRDGSVDPLWWLEPPVREEYDEACGDEPQERPGAWLPEIGGGIDTPAGFARLADYACESCPAWLSQVDGKWICPRGCDERRAYVSDASIVEPLYERVKEEAMEDRLIDDEILGEGGLRMEKELDDVAEQLEAGRIALERQELDERFPRQEPVAEVADPPRMEGWSGWPCKIEGCPNRADASRGIYAHLCDEHKAAKQLERASKIGASKARVENVITGQMEGERGSFEDVEEPQIADDRELYGDLVPKANVKEKSANASLEAAVALLEEERSRLTEQVEGITDAIYAIEQLLTDRP